MDLRTGRTYATKEDALAAGVPASDIAEVTPSKKAGDPPDVRVTKGPFKGREYRRNALGQLERIR